MKHPNPGDRWPHADREAEYRLLLPAAVHTVAEIVEVARPDWGERLGGPDVEASPAPWPPSVGPDPQSPAGLWIALYRDLRALVDTSTQSPAPELLAAERLVGLLSQAVWAGSQGAWLAAATFAKRALRDSWKVTGFRP